MRPLAVAVMFAALVALPGCVTTHEPGWQGQNATAFGTAEKTCNAEAAENPGARETAFRACMARHGWTYGRRDRG